MDIKINVEAEAQRVSFFNITNSEELEIESYDLEDENDLERFIEDIESLYESNELNITQDYNELLTIDPDSIKSFKLLAPKEQELNLDMVTLKNINPNSYVEIIKNANEGDIFYIRSESGDIVLDLISQTEEDFNPKNLNIPYFDCTQILDNFELINESYYDYICDKIGIDFKYNNSKFEIDYINFKAKIAKGALYKAVVDEVSNLLTLEKLPYPEKILACEYQEES